MNLKRLGHLAAAAILATVSALPAAAATVLTVITGTVSTGADGNGFFGKAGAALDGQAFRLSVLFDPDRGKRTSEPGSFDRVSGSGTAPGANPTLSVTFTIGSQSRTLFGTSFSAYALCDISSCGDDQFLLSVEDTTHAADGTTSTDSISIEPRFGGDVIAARLGEDFRTDEAPSNHEDIGWLSFVSVDAATGQSVTTWGNLTFGSMSVIEIMPPPGPVSLPAPVPLPAPGLILLGAISGLAVLRRRRRTAV